MGMSLWIIAAPQAEIDRLRLVPRDVPAVFDALVETASGQQFPRRPAPHAFSFYKDWQLFHFLLSGHATARTAAFAKLLSVLEVETLVRRIDFAAFKANRSYTYAEMAGNEDDHTLTAEAVREIFFPFRDFLDEESAAGNGLISAIK